MQTDTHQPGRIKPIVNPHRQCLAIALACLGMSACGPVMEATRPTPVDLSQLAVGEKRVDVVNRISSNTRMAEDSPK